MSDDHDALVRKQLPSGVIDVSVGDAVVVRKAVLTALGGKINLHTSSIDCDYLPPAGYPPLVELLEQHYATASQHVVVTSGAKQGLQIAFHAVKQMGLKAVALHRPFWAQMPAAVRLAGLQVVYAEAPVEGAAFLMVSPNNPDGSYCTPDHAAQLRRWCDNLGVPLIHDAVYNSPIYTANPLSPRRQFADITLYSASKRMGLSGLRVGWLTTPSLTIKRWACQYIEAATMGTSVLSQQVLHYVIDQVQTRHLGEQIDSAAAAVLFTNKQILSSVSTRVFKDAPFATQRDGMFGWLKKGPDFNPDAARIHVADGSLFGDPTRVRLNLAVDTAVMTEVVARLNASVKCVCAPHRTM